MWLKILRQRRLQTLMIFLIIAVCTTLLAGALNILTSLEKPCYDLAKTCHTATAKVYPYINNDKSVYTLGRQFSKLSNVENVEYEKSHYVDETILFNGKKGDIFVSLTQYQDKIFGHDRFLEGNRNIVKNLSDKECAIPACISNEYDVHLGDTVTVKFPKKNVTYKVVAVYTDPYETSTAFDSNILINELPAKGKINIYLYGKTGVTGKQIESAYREKYDGQLMAFLYSLEERIDKGLIVGKICGAIFLSIGLIMLLVSGLMIHYMIKNVMLTDAKSISIYKTMGYTSNDILFMYLKLYFIIVSAACFAGIIGSVYLSSILLTSMIANMGQLRASHTLLSGILCYLITIGFVISIITVIIRKSKKIKPVHALNGMDFGGIKKKKHYKGNSRITFSAFGIAFRTFTREKKDTVNIIITCIVTVFSVNFAVISLDAARTLKQNNDYWLGVDKADVMVSVMDKTQFDLVKNIINQDVRTDYCLYANYLNTVTIKWEKGIDSTRMNALVYDDFKKSKLPVTEGRNPKTSNEIAIATTMVNDLHKSIGDYITVYLDGKVRAELLITGFFQTYMQTGSMCRLTTSAYQKHNCDFSYNNISIYLKNSKDMNHFIKDMRVKIDGNGNVIKRTEQYGSIMDMIAEPQKQAIPPVTVLVLLIAGLNIFSIVYLKNMKSQRINGIYKCIGYTTWHLILSNEIYVAAIACISVMITLPISVITYAAIMKSCLSIFSLTEYPVQYNYAHLIASGIAVIIVFIISTLLSSKALFKVTARDLVNE